ncbi:hypothetical protein FOZ61_004989 [Perkinsus olseni]|uniref:Amino acid transporter transmembrane domain-containing protein n=1 Tax=Perkinsus olseni TaxID=32597 RepID=A0A7J6LIY2_PEROL|nr:hypothetical protein FOZ61_004989 [Perkinsus olseni]
MSEKSSISTKVSDFSVDSVATGGRPDGSSNFRTVINFALVAVGVGILALPRAIAQGGWVLGSILLAVAWGVAQYGTYLLYRCMYMNPEGGERFMSFQAIGKACFGRPGEIFTAFVQYLDLLLVCSLLVILVGDGMYELVSQLDHIWWCVIFVCVMLPLAMLPSMKEVAVVSFIGITAAFVTVIAVIGASVRETSDPVRVHDHFLWPLNANTAILAFTNFMNAFAVTTVVPTLVDNMQKPKQFPRVLAAGFLVIVSIFAAIAYSGYAGFGHDLLDYPNITYAIAYGRPRGDWLVIIVQVAIEVVCFSHFLVMFNPVCVGVEDAVEAIHGGKVRYWIKMISRAILMVICFVIAVSVPGFGSLVDLIGATAVMFLQIIFPVVFFLVLERKRVKLGFKPSYGSAVSKYVQYVVMGISLVLAVIGMIFGTWSAILNW